MKDVVQLLVETFVKLGISHAFGIPGKSVAPLILEFGNQDIEFILGRHESGAGFAAGGYALTNNKLGIVVATSGPGGTNLVTAAAHAKMNCLPVLFITGHESVAEMGIPQCQDSSQFGIDLAEIMKPVTLFSTMVTRADAFPAILTYAMREAMTGRKGPVHLCIPFDVMISSVSETTIHLPSTSIDYIATNLTDVVDQLQNARNPVILAGKGVVLSGAQESLAKFAEKYHLPIVTTPGGKGSIHSSHPLYYGPLGLGGHRRAMDLLESDVDLLLVMGSRLSDTALAGLDRSHYPQQVIQFDIAREFMGGIIQTEYIPVLGDLRTNLDEILRIYPHEPIHLHTATPYHDPLPDLEFLSVAEVCQSVSDLIPENTTIFADDGAHGYHAVRWLDLKPGVKFFFDSYFASMANAIGMAIGAKFADRERNVICLTGDGCIFMLGSEISTCVAEQLPVIFIVINNGQLDMALKGMRQFTGRTDGTIFKQPLDVAAYAASMGADSARCTTRDEFNLVFKQALSFNKPFVIDVIVDKEEIPSSLAREMKLD
ncbi:thiamine pyrophosphate-binding protein [Paenibacillus sp. D2_2]|uniref:thiamine pyrophosphate-binding protein n=1 Tax=Paenibacillus sp. D2_2 TaxID=3073092 RepID=UPI0028165FFF|nr:thiamine pyrophosphate-binding protein [Paenibacillus sp. D2_2]WMT43175.1 thiamine pyrophosphate-binding protein [Paenibacillus sp. D2_2]